MTDLEQEMLGYLFAKQRVEDAHALLDRVCLKLAQLPHHGGQNYRQLAIIRDRLRALLAAWDELAVLS
jgi:hypothetical protein